MFDLSKAERERARSIHEKSNVLIGHSDFIGEVCQRRGIGEHSVIKNIYIPKFRKGGVNAGICVIGGDTEYAASQPLTRAFSPFSNYPLRRALETLDDVTSEEEESGGELLIATCAEDIEKAKREEKFAIIPSFEGCMPIENDLKLLRILYRLGLRCIQPVHFYSNQVADSCHNRSNGGLTNFGVEVIKEMNRLGIVIDVAHISEASFWDALKFTGDPILCSHTAAHSIVKNKPQNLKDEQIQALAENGGVMGIFNMANHISTKPKATIEDIMSHIKHISDLVGVDHIGIGFHPGWKKQSWTEDVYKNLFGEYNWVFLGSPGIQDLDDVSKFPDITMGLVANGYSDQDIQKILGGNFLRVFKRVFGK